MTTCIRLVPKLQSVLQNAWRSKTMRGFERSNIMAANFQKCFGNNRHGITVDKSMGTNEAYSMQSSLEYVKMSEHVELWKLKSGNSSLPLVLLFPWLKARRSAIQKYANLYHQRGMDVLVVKGRMKHFLWPPYAFKLGHELDKCLRDIPSYEKFFVHCFSIGAYNYTIVRMNAKSGVPCFPSEKVVGQIFDSIVIGTTANMTEGLAISVTANKLLQRTIQSTAEAYIQLTSRKTQDLYDESIQFCKEKFLPVPSLFFYSDNDVMCNVDSMRQFLAFQKERYGDDIWEKSWPISIHAGHLRSHEEDYLSMWKKFLDKLTL